MAQAKKTSKKTSKQSSKEPARETVTGGSDRAERDAKNWAVLCHLLAIPAGTIPFGNVIAPLIIWLFKRDDHPFIDDQGREALNFQISMSIYIIIAAILTVIIIGLFALFALLIADVILAVIAAVEASKGNSYRYPFTMRFVN
ncbi:DUF4870 domain-containing protein [Acidobacteriota bacterium]